MNNKVEALSGAFERAKLTDNPRAFFPCLCKFCQILQNQQFAKVLKKIVAKSKKLVESLKSHEKKAFDELKNREHEIRSYLLNSGIQNERVIQLLDTCQDRLKISRRLDRLLFVPLDQVLYLLLNDESYDHSAFVSTFGKINRINDDKYIHMHEAFPHFDEWEKELVYFSQVKQTADWYALNQILVFYERYDLRHYDNLEQTLKESGRDTMKLQEEHLALIAYAYADNPKVPACFPSVAEYKQYMSSVLESIMEMMPSVSVGRDEVYTYEYNAATGELMIDNEKPIKFIITQDPACLLKIMTQSKKKGVSDVDAHNKLYQSDHDKKKRLESAEWKEILDILRQISNRLKNKPPFIITQADKNNLKQHNLLISSSYRSK